MLQVLFSFVTVLSKIVPLSNCALTGRLTNYVCAQRKRDNKREMKKYRKVQSPEKRRTVKDENNEAMKRARCDKKKSLEVAIDIPPTATTSKKNKAGFSSSIEPAMKKAKGFDTLPTLTRVYHCHLNPRLYHCNLLQQNLSLT